MLLGATGTRAKLKATESNLMLVTTGDDPLYRAGSKCSRSSVRVYIRLTVLQQQQLVCVKHCHADDALVLQRV
jgi:hypothetical protein